MSEKSEKSDESTCTKAQNGFLNLVNPKFKNFSRPMLLALPVFVVGAIAFIYQLNKGINASAVQRFMKTEARCKNPGMVPDAPTDLVNFGCVAFFQVDVADSCTYDPDLVGGQASDVPACPDSYFQVDPVDGEEVTGFPKYTADPFEATTECVNYDGGQATCYYYGASAIDFTAELGTAFAFMGTVEVLITFVLVSILWCGGCIKSNTGESFKTAVQEVTSGDTMGDKGEAQLDA